MQFAGVVLIREGSNSGAGETVAKKEAATEEQQQQQSEEGKTSTVDVAETEGQESITVLTY